MPTHYQVLGVDPKATDAAIRAKFHIIAKQYHPDTGQDAAAPAAQMFFEQAQAAYNVLKMPAQRAAYDAQLQLLAPKCSVCKGTKKVQERTGFRIMEWTCQHCRGTGKEP